MHLTVQKLLLLICPFCANIYQMSENKNVQSLSTKERIGVGLGAAAIGALLVGGVGSANEMGSIDTSYTLELPPHDQSATPLPALLEPLTSATENATGHSPVFKGKVTIKKSDATKATTTRVATNHKSQVIIPTPPPIKTVQSIVEKASLHAELMTVPENVKAIMDRDTVYITSSECSGSLVRNETGEAIGIVTAEHCGLRGSGQHSTPRILGTDGNEYMVSPTPIEAMTGPDQMHLTRAGVVKELFVPAANDTSYDMAFGAFDGHTAQEVTAAYNHNKLSARDLSKLKLGDRMYISGWPVSQPEDGGNFERQNFPLSYLGEDTITTDIGETLRVIWAAVPTSKDGADCSFGDSGGKAFVMEGVHARSVGVLAAFTDFTGKLYGNVESGVTSRKYFERKYNVNLSPFDAICGIATESPTVKNGGEVVKPVLSYNEIPIQHNSITQELPAFAEQLIQKAHDEFFDPNYVKTWVSGAVNLDPNGNGHWVMNPVIFYDKESGSAVLATYTDNAKDALELDFVSDLKDQKFNGYPRLSNVSGELVVFNGMYGSNGFTSKSGGAIFGQYLESLGAIESVQQDPAFSLYYDDPTQSLQIMQYKHN